MRRYSEAVKADVRRRMRPAYGQGPSSGPRPAALGAPSGAEAEGPRSQSGLLRERIRAEEACAWVAAFLGWYNDPHRHSGMRWSGSIRRHRKTASRWLRW